MAEFKMAAIIKLIRLNEWSILCKWWRGKSEWSFFFLEMVGTNLGKCGWVWEEKLRWLNPRWPNSRWLPSSSWVRMKEFESDWISLSQSFVQNGWIQDGRIQDGCHHQVSQIEWVKYFVQMVKREEGVKFFFFWKWYEPILASVGEFERKN